MAHLSLVKLVSRLQEEQKHHDEIVLESAALAFARGSVIEVAGPASAGKASIALTLQAKLTADGEVCAVVDSSNGFDPCSAKTARVVLKNLLRVRCGGDIKKAFMAADYLVQAKGFGAIWLNLSGLYLQKLRMVPKAYWYRYRTRIKETPTLLFVTAEEPVTGSASQQSFVFEREKAKWSGSGKFKLLREIGIRINSRKHFEGGTMRTKIEANYDNG